MVSLSTQKDFREVQRLPFCYVCGRDFLSTDVRDRDHVPPKSVFAKGDRTPALSLPTHKACNAEHGLLDHKVGQLIALKRGQIPARRDRQLRIKIFQRNLGAVVNLDLSDVVRRWVRGFHIALYRERLPPGPLLGAVQTPFPSGAPTPSGIRIDSLPPQNFVFVKTIKVQRAKRNLDTIISNNGKLTYECVWCQSDNSGPWLCVFGVNLYDWKDLGLTPGQPARGCAGFYQLHSGVAPAAAARAVTTPIIIPNIDRHDPFAS